MVDGRLNDTEEGLKLWTKYHKQISKPVWSTRGAQFVNLNIDGELPAAGTRPA